MIFTFNTTVKVTPLDNDKLKQWVADRPVVVEVEADTVMFQFYTGGVLADSTYNECGQ